MIETMLDKYLKRKGLVIVNAEYKNKLEMATWFYMTIPGETEDEYIERVIKLVEPELAEVYIREKESKRIDYIQNSRR